jgi:hypothetical protein
LDQQHRSAVRAGPPDLPGSLRRHRHPPSCQEGSAIRWPRLTIRTAPSPYREWRGRSYVGRLR